LRHEANNSAEGLKAPTVCHALSGDLGGFSPRTSSVPAITTEVYPARAKRSAFSKRSSSGSSWSAIMSEHTKRFFNAVRFRTERPARRDARPSRRAQGGSAHRSRRHDERSLTIRGYSLPSDGCPSVPPIGRSQMRAGASADDGADGQRNYRPKGCSSQRSVTDRMMWHGQGRNPRKIPAPRRRAGKAPASD
jgi:hypothetical protein